MARPDFRAAAARRLAEEHELSPAIVSLLSPDPKRQAQVRTIALDHIRGEERRTRRENHPDAPMPRDGTPCFDLATDDLDRAEQVVAVGFDHLAHELGSGRATENVRSELADLERALASVDALAARLAARAAYGRAA